MNYFDNVVHSDLMKMIDNAAGNMQSLMLTEFAVLLFSISVMFNVASSSLKKRGLAIDYADLIRVFLMMILLSTYGSWMKTVDSIIDRI